jgi:hypothetical protein
MLIGQSVKADCWALLIFSLGMIAFEFVVCNIVGR